MKKADIISRMAEGAGITKVQADKAFDGLLNAITDGLKDGGRVVFVGFGTFSVAERKARTGRNPKTGEVIQIPESKKVKFTPSEGLKKGLTEHGYSKVSITSHFRSSRKKRARV